MAPNRAVKVLLATRPRALLRSTLTARFSAKMRRLGIVLRKSFCNLAPSLCGGLRKLLSRINS
jgi:hypothetical protein